MSQYRLIEEAIRGRKRIIATYNGSVRCSCPHLLGRDSDGREKALLCQLVDWIAGKLGPSGTEGEWRCVFVDEMSDVLVTEGAWVSCPNYTGRSNCMETVEVRA